MASAVGTVGSKNGAGGVGAAYDESFEPTGGQRVTDAHGRYYDAVLAGRVFQAANSGAVTSGAGLSATVATISLTNPVGSGRYLVVLEATWAFSTAAAAATAVYVAAMATNA